MGRHALLVASQSYTDNRLAALRAPAGDLAALGRVLRDPRVGAFDVEPLLDESVQTVREGIEGFLADRKLDDLALVYFACHGVKDQRGRLYLAMRDTRTDRLGSTAIPSNFVNEALEACLSQQILLLLDCCYSGAFARGYTHRGDESAQVQERFSGVGRAVITASDALEYAWETDAAPQETQRAPSSVFTQAVVRGLESGDADVDGDGLITPQDLYQFVFAEIRGVTQAQTPTMSSTGVKGEFQIARSVRGARRPPEHRSTEAATKARHIIDLSPSDVDFGEVPLGYEPVARVRITVDPQEPWRYAKSGEFFSVTRQGDALVLRLTAGSGIHAGSVWVKAAGTEATLDVRARVTVPKESSEVQLDEIVRRTVSITPATQKHLGVLAAALKPNERPLVASEGRRNGDSGLLLGTNTRIVFAYRRLGVGTIVEVAYERIRGCALISSGTDAGLALELLPAPLKPVEVVGLRVPQAKAIALLTCARTASGFSGRTDVVLVSGEALEQSEVLPLLPEPSGLFTETDAGHRYAIAQAECDVDQAALLRASNTALGVIGAKPVSEGGHVVRGLRPSGRPTPRISIDRNWWSSSGASVITISAVSDHSQRRSLPGGTVQTLMKLIRDEGIPLQLPDSWMIGVPEVQPGPVTLGGMGRAFIGLLIFLVIIALAGIEYWFPQ